MRILHPEELTHVVPMCGYLSCILFSSSWLPPPPSSRRPSPTAFALPGIIVVICGFAETQNCLLLFHFFTQSSFPDFSLSPPLFLGKLVGEQKREIKKRGRKNFQRERESKAKRGLYICHSADLLSTSRNSTEEREREEERRLAVLQK